MSLLLFFAGARAAAAPPTPAPTPTPTPEPGGAGRIYAPVRKRKPERLVFLERELLEQIERRNDLEQQKRQIKRLEAKEFAARESEYRGVVAALAALQPVIAQIEADIATEIAMRRLDDEDAIIAIVAATIH